MELKKIIIIKHTLSKDTVSKQVRMNFRVFNDHNNRIALMIQPCWPLIAAFDIIQHLQHTIDFQHDSAASRNPPIDQRQRHRPHNHHPTTTTITHSPAALAES